MHAIASSSRKFGADALRIIITHLGHHVFVRSGLACLQASQRIADSSTAPAEVRVAGFTGLRCRPHPTQGTAGQRQCIGAVAALQHGLQVFCCWYLSIQCWLLIVANRMPQSHHNTPGSEGCGAPTAALTVNPDQNMNVIELSTFRLR